MTKNHNTEDPKAAFINNARQYMKSVISPVPDIAPYEGLFVKLLSVRDMADFFRRCDEFENSYDDGLNGVREKALMILDGTGQPMFHPDNREDVAFLAELPSQVLAKVNEYFFQINGEQGLKKLSQDAKNS